MTKADVTDWQTLLTRAQYYRIHSFEVHCIRAGEGPALLMLHGGGTWAYSFRHNIPPLSRYFAVHAPDMPAHGYTRPICKRPCYNLKTTNDFLCAYLDRFNIEKTYLVGHSWGGGWALHFAARYPDRVMGLAILSSSGIPVRDHGIWELLKWPVIGRLLASLATENTLRNGLKVAFYNSNRVNREMVRSVYGPLRFSGNRSGQCQFARNMDWSTVQADLPSIKIPTLIIWGCFDNYLDIDCGRQMCELLPDASLVAINHCGHCPQEEYPAQINRLIQKFFLEGQISG